MEEKDMGMTDKQFDGFVRFVLDDIKDIINEEDEKAKEEKLKRVEANLQKILDD